LQFQSFAKVLQFHYKHIASIAKQTLYSKARDLAVIHLIFFVQDDDNRLTKSEFKRFLFPHLSDDAGASEVIVHEAHEALDADYDGRVSQSGKTFIVIDETFKHW
jgi:hypothetical protein